MAKLASIHDLSENNILAKMQGPDVSFTGLKKFTEDVWEWTDGSPNNFTSWADGQPSGDGGCAVLQKSGDWSAAQCDKEAGYHCKLKTSSYYSCPLGWQLFNGFCYLEQDELLSWEDARSGCVSKGGDLVSILDIGEQSEVFALIHSGPECPEHFELHGDTCYLAVPEQVLSWKDAEAQCQETDSHLAIIRNVEQNDIVKNMFQNMQIWIGLTDQQTEGTWMYADGSPLAQFNKWKEGAPNGGEGENCAVMLPNQDNGVWDDKNCTSKAPFVCTKPKGDPTESKWIGLSDRGSLNSFHWSDNSFVSFSNWGSGFPNTHGGEGDVCVYMDILTGGWEHTFCHDPKSSICKTNIEISDIPPDHYGCTQDQIAYGESCYDIIPEYVTWDEAQDDCILRRGDLLTINSEAEQAKITSIIAETQVHYWLGLRWNEERQEWEWVGGDEFTYSHWGDGEPDMVHHSGNNSAGWCAYMHRYGDDIGAWRVVSCDDIFRFELFTFIFYPPVFYL